jgi:hypothetical protein
MYVLECWTPVVLSWVAVFGARSSLHYPICVNYYSLSSSSLPLLTRPHIKWHRCESSTVLINSSIPHQLNKSCEPFNVCAPNKFWTLRHTSNAYIWKDDSQGPRRLQELESCTKIPPRTLQLLQLLTDLCESAFVRVSSASSERCCWSAYPMHRVNSGRSLKV